MAVAVTERWSDRQYQPGGGATRAFDVTGVSDEAAALTAVDASTALAVPVVGDANDLTSQLQVIDSPSVTRIGPAFFRVFVTYAVPEGVSGFDTKPKLRWQFGTVQAPIDQDINGNPITNSAGEAFDPPPQGERNTTFLQVRKNQVFFDPLLAVLLQNTVNSDTFIVDGASIAAPNRARLMYMRPTKDYEIGETPLEIEYRFEMRGGVGNPFLIRIPDRGYTGIGFDSSAGMQIAAEIHTREDPPRPVRAPVALDGRGRPLNMDRYQVGEDDLPFGSVEIPPGADVEPTSHAVFLRWNDLRKAPFRRLGLQ